MKINKINGIMILSAVALLFLLIFCVGFFINLKLVFPVSIILSGLFSIIGLILQSKICSKTEKISRKVKYTKLIFILSLSVFTIALIYTIGLIIVIGVNGFGR